MTVTTARQNAVAKQDETIASNVAKIEATRRPSALEMMASRLNITPNGLKNTLMGTAFKGADDDQFAALIIVANEYGLNPLTKEIYAFPAKGGIVPMVSIDGWIRIMNQHPMFDGIDFVDLPDVNGKLYAIEAVIHRKDRTRPIRVTEYLEECKRNTDPWSKSPARMLRHRSLIQCARYAFGFSGIYADDGEIIGDVQLVGETSNTPMPRRIDYVDQQDDEEAARDLDAKAIAAERGLSDGEQVDEDGVITNSSKPQRASDEENLEAPHPAQAKANEIIAASKRCAAIVDLNKLVDASSNDVMSMPDEFAAMANEAFEQARNRLSNI
jgi:phage recombination protein Bet